MTESSAPHKPSEAIPDKIGPYLIERELGAGGMGTVYLGKHAETGELVAVKVLPASMAREPGFVARFNREIAAMQQLKSPHIVELFDSGEENGTYYYAMEYVPGETLTERLRREKRIPWQQVLDIGVQVCRALKAAHDCGIIHRDLKPSNLLIHQNGVVKLTDFGVAQVFASSKLTVTGGVLGTAEYMSPEQTQGKRTTKQSDLYSLGAVLYVMLTGRPPFTGKTTLEIAQKHRFSQFDSPKRIVPEIPFWLDEIVCKCLAKKPEDRYPDAYVLSLRLQEVAKKMELKSSGTFDFDAESDSRETLADSPLNQDVGGTVVRDLFRAQLEAEDQANVWGKLFDNTWVLVGLLTLIVGAGWGLSQWNRQDPQELFERGQELMAQPEGPGWETARRDYFEPLLKADPERWGPEVAPYLEQIERYDLKKNLLGSGASRRKSQTATEPELILRQARELQQSGQHASALARLSALEQLLAGDPDQRTMRELAQQLQNEFAEEGRQQREEFLQSRMDLAQTLERDGATDDARAIWRGVLELYHDDHAASDFVAAARKHLQESGGNP